MISAADLPSWSTERVPCPTCDAGIGMPCLTSGDSAYTFAVRPHKLRKRLRDILLAAEEAKK